jgi:tetratricopeptide (TPR) repeat protein
MQVEHHALGNIAAVAEDESGALLAAKSAAAAGRVAEAFSRYRDLLNGPHAAIAHKEIGDLYARHHGDEDAAQAYARAVTLKPDYAEAHNNLGNVLWRKDKDRRAITHYERAVALKPDLAQAHLNLGLILSECGNLERAAASLQTALRLDSGSFRALRGLAMVHRQANRLDQAAAAIRAARDLEPNDPEVLATAADVFRVRREFNEALDCARRGIELCPGQAVGYIELAATLCAMGDHAGALPHARQAVEVAPTSARSYGSLGFVLFKNGKIDEAYHGLKHALRLDPKDLKALFYLGVLLERTERYKQAETAYRKVIARQPGYRPAAVSLGNLYISTGRPAAAEPILRQVIAEDPVNGAAWSSLALALQDLGRCQEAVEAAQRGTQDAPDSPETHVNLGVTLQAVGDIEGSRSSFLRALDLEPTYVPAMYALAIGDGADSTMFERLRERLADESLLDDERSQLLFALAKQHDARGEHERAFKAAVEGNSLEAKRARYDESKHDRWVSELIRVFSRSYFEEHRHFGSKSDKPVFVVGMPRSGTTLVEQILASHSDVFGAGELDSIPELARSISRFVRTADAFPASVLDLDEPAALRIATAYLRTLRGLAGPSARVTDKLPSNIFYLGFATLLFPNAKIIYCERDPLDTFISGYFMRFRWPVAHTNGQRQFAHFYKTQQRLLTHWRQVLPVDILTVRYEDLLADQVGHTRRMLDFCGLPWEDACLEFHRSVRPVRTGSSAQVRKPLFHSSKRRAAPYRAYLEELKGMLADARHPKHRV